MTPAKLMPSPRAIAVPIMVRTRRGAFHTARGTGLRVAPAWGGVLWDRAGIGLDMASIVAAGDADLHLHMHLQERRAADQTAIVVQVVAVACCRPRSARRSDDAVSLTVPYRSSPHSPQPSMTRQPYSSNRFSNSQGSR